MRVGSHLTGVLGSDNKISTIIFTDESVDIPVGKGSLAIHNTYLRPNLESDFKLPAPDNRSYPELHQFHSPISGKPHVCECDAFNGVEHLSYTKLT